MENTVFSSLPDYVYAAMRPLQAAGFHAYLVGGCVRDLLRGVPPHDFDMTTDATPDEMLSVFADYRTVTAGLKHGTLTVILDGAPVEITTHRHDGTYTDSRRPDSVSFTRDLSEDLARRDFTVNAMAWSEETGLVDLFGGRADLANGVLRAVGDPCRRFGEDALRIMRAFRFAAQLDFEIEAETLRGAAEMREGLARIAKERIQSELWRTLSEKVPERGLKYLMECGCAPLVFGDIAINAGAFSYLSLLPPAAPVRLAALLVDGTETEAAALCRTLRSSNADREAVCAVLRAVKESEPPRNLPAARRFVCDHFAAFEGALALWGVMGKDVAESLAMCRRVLRDKTAVELRRLAVNGAELQQLGVAPAKTGALLRRLQEAVWQDPQKNKKAELLALADRIVKERTL